MSSAAVAANVSSFASAQAIKWRGGVVNVETSMPFYQRQGYQGIWTSNNGLSKRGKELVEVLNDAWLDGLEPLDYLAGFPDNPSRLRGDQLVGAELFLSDAAFRFARDLYAGRTTPSVSEPDIVIARKKLDVIALLGSMDKNGPLTVIERLRPTHSQYDALRKALVKTSDPTKRRKIIVNMERWRWLPRKLGDKHVFVNTAAFLMYTRSGGKDVDRRRVIVGKEFHKTPIFSDNIKYSEFNPTWTVTPSIAGNEMLPKLRKDPNYLTKKGYDLYASWKGDAPKMNATQIDWSSVSGKRFPYRIVQPAGPQNALGQVKFLFPNKFNVYLHDTANRDLFNNQDRALSHGCVRVHDPLEFAKLLYKLDDNPAVTKIDGIVQSKETKGINFQHPIPVHLTYFTSWVKDGKVQYFADIYKRDRLISNILFGKI
ncbi:MAG: L,D-transpeptidase family protein [Salaquimonas sp.]